MTEGREREDPEKVILFGSMLIIGHVESWERGNVNRRMTTLGFHGLFSCSLGEEMCLGILI